MLVVQPQAVDLQRQRAAAGGFVLGDALFATTRIARYRVVRPHRHHVNTSKTRIQKSIPRLGGLRLAD